MVVLYYRTFSRFQTQRKKKMGLKSPSPKEIWWRQPPIGVVVRCLNPHRRSELPFPADRSSLEWDYATQGAVQYSALKADELDNVRLCKLCKLINARTLRGNVATVSHLHNSSLPICLDKFVCHKACTGVPCGFACQVHVHGGAAAAPPPLVLEHRQLRAIRQQHYQEILLWVEQSQWLATAASGRLHLVQWVTAGP